MGLGWPRACKMFVAASTQGGGTVGWCGMVEVVDQHLCPPGVKLVSLVWFSLVTWYS